MQKPNRNFFDLSHDVKMTCNLGELVPICLLETVPGDKISMEGNALVRFAPLIAPVMHRLDCTIHYFFVPKRIMWSGWEDWIVGNAEAGDHPRVTLPLVGGAFNDTGSLGDYLGVPSPDDITAPDQNEIVSAFPYMAYQKVWYEYYRDQNLQDDDTVLNGLMFDGLDDGDNSSLIAALSPLRRRAWEHDYFTSCLPFAQKGQAVTLPIGASVVEVVDPTVAGMVGTFRDSTSNSATTGTVTNLAASGSQVAGADAYYDPQGTLVTGATQTTINAEVHKPFVIR